MDSLLLTAEFGAVTDDRNEDDVPLTDARPPEEWADSIAAAEGIQREEAVKRLVSSYWTLTEVYEMISETEGDIGLAGTNDIDPISGGTVENSEDVSAVRDSENVSTVGDGENAPRVENSEAASTGEDDADALPVEDATELGERLDRLEEALQAQQDTHASIEADLGQLTQRIDGLEGELRSRQSSIESRLDAELEYLETILSHLVDSTEALDKDLGSIIEGWPTVQDRQAEQERLVDFERTASQLGVRSGECKRCGSSVDLGVLPTADCPHCGRRFVDIEPASGWFGLGADTLVTAEDTEPDGER
jgi:archaellum component FlaC